MVFELTQAGWIREIAMGYASITKNDVAASQAKKLLDALGQPAEDRGVECTLLLAVASLLLGQTADRARKQLQPEQLQGEELDKQTKDQFVERLDSHLQDAARSWLGSWSERRLPRLSGPAFGQWKQVKEYKRIPALGPEQFEEQILSHGKHLAADMPKYRLLRIIRNAIAHGGVQWTTAEHTSRVDGQSRISGVLFTSLTNPAKCEACKQIKEDREALKRGDASFELIHAPIAGFHKFIKDWAETLAAARVEQSELENAISRLAHPSTPDAA